ncbi:hypothetical protein K7X08_026062 [Anisodus acutangulus]|uniref:Uncharacterized protein n=1 Tax=Anisodus acutangulus TaxID=402998 RepID=A0A9Q1N1U4_9SOLA|nr:hypothetical protein K7X08_026062 [Anisodus acutangulus]
MAGFSRVVATAFLMLMLVFASGIVAKARTCESQSRRFRGLCFKKEKSATKEAIGILEKYIVSNPDAKRRKICTEDANEERNGWCNRILPIQGTCRLDEKELHKIVTKLVNQFMNNRQETENTVKLGITGEALRKPR